jgi:hypothetical protein
MFRVHICEHLVFVQVTYSSSAKAPALLLTSQHTKLAKLTMTSITLGMLALTAYTGGRITPPTMPCKATLPFGEAREALLFYCATAV